MGKCIFPTNLRCWNLAESIYSFTWDDRKTPKKWKLTLPSTSNYGRYRLCDIHVFMYECMYLQGNYSFCTSSFFAILLILLLSLTNWFTGIPTNHVVPGLLIIMPFSSSSITHLSTCPYSSYDLNPICSILGVILASFFVYFIISQLLHFRC